MLSCISIFIISSFVAVFAIKLTIVYLVVETLGDHVVNPSDNQILENYIIAVYCLDTYLFLMYVYVVVQMIKALEYIKAASRE